MIIFLALIVIGFTIPGLLNLNPAANNAPKAVEPRVCQADSDCYLICNDQPLSVLCSQNLCQQNACTEQPKYPFKTEPIAFHLTAHLNETTIDLINKSNPRDLFATFNTESVKSFSSVLPLRLILEKINVKLTAECLQIDQKKYCRNDQHKVRLLVNGKETYTYEDYVPQQGDSIEMVYS